MDESEDRAEIAQALLDQDTGNFTVEATEHLEHAGTDLLVMDRGHLPRAWRGFGLRAMLACEAKRAEFGLGTGRLAC